MLKRIIPAILAVMMMPCATLAASDDLKASAEKAYNEMLEKRPAEVTVYAADYEKKNIFSSEYMHDYVYSDTGAGKEGDFLRWSIVKKAKGLHGITKYSDRYEHRFIINPVYIMTKAQERSIRSIVKRDAKRIKFTTKSRAKNLKKIYKYVHSKLAYKRSQNNVYKAYKTKAGNCVSYAGLFYLTCREKGIPCRIVRSEGHMWNIVKIGNRWYHCDSCWDDNRSEKNWKWFLKGNDVKGSNHKLAPEYQTKEFKKAFPIKKSFRF